MEYRPKRLVKRTSSQLLLEFSSGVLLFLLFVLGLGIGYVHGVKWAVVYLPLYLLPAMTVGLGVTSHYKKSHDTENGKLSHYLTLTVLPTFVPAVLTVIVGVIGAIAFIAYLALTKSVAAVIVFGLPALIPVAIGTAISVIMISFITFISTSIGVVVSIKIRQ